MHDWHVTPEYINRVWTEEKFLLMFSKRNARLRRESSEGKEEQPRAAQKKMKDTDFFAKLGIKPRVQ